MNGESRHTNAVSRSRNGPTGPSPGPRVPRVKQLLEVRRPVRPARTVHRPGRPLGRWRRAGHLRPRRWQDHRGCRRAGAIQRAAPDPHRQHPGAVVPGHGVAPSPGHRRGPQAPAQLRCAPLGHCLSARHVRRLQLRHRPGHRYHRDRRLRPGVDLGRLHRQPARARWAVPSRLAGAAWSAPPRRRTAGSDRAANQRWATNLIANTGLGPGQQIQVQVRLLSLGHGRVSTRHLIGVICRQQAPARA